MQCYVRTDRHLLEKFILLIGKMHHLSSIMKINKSFKWSNLLSSQSCLTLFSLQVLITFPIILSRMSFLNYIPDDLFLYFNIHIALLVGFSFPLCHYACFWSSCLDDILSLDPFFFF